MIKRIRARIQHNRASRGQIIILVAVFAVALAGMIGLSIDLGYTFAEKRAVQNAADAGAMAGAHALTKWSTSNPTESAFSDVETVVDANKMNASTTQTYTCEYLNDAGDDVGNCSGVVPPTATGIHVKVTETHSTFFIHVIPFAPNTVTTSASASAHVQGVTTGVGTDSPFIACGYGTELAHGGTMDLLTGSSGDYSINSQAYGQTFILHAPHVANCGLGNQSWKGLGDGEANAGASIPGWFDTLNGDKAGPTRSRVYGINGCSANDVTTDGCVLIVPIADASNGTQMHVVIVGAFLVKQTAANRHEGTLLEEYKVQPTGQGEWTDSNGWSRGSNALATIRLTN